MTKMLIAIAIISAIILITVWLPGWIEKKDTKPVNDEQLFRSRGYGIDSTEDKSDAGEVAKEIEVKSKTDWKITITWLIGSLNGVLLIFSQIQKVFGNSVGK